MSQMLPSRRVRGAAGVPDRPLSPAAGDSAGPGGARAAGRDAGELDSLESADSAAAEATALLLANTYEAERRRYLGMLHPNSSFPGYDPNRFIEEVGQIPSERRRGTAENVEDNPAGAARRHSPALTVWLKLAGELLRRRVDPETFIRRQFAVLPPGSRPPLPAMFLNPRGLENLLLGLRTNEREIEIALRGQAQRCWTEIGQVERSSLGIRGEPAALRVINDLEIPMTALFRFTFALDAAARPDTADPAAFRETAERFRDAAALEYLSDAEAYDNVWKQRIPAGFPAQARRIYDRMHGVTPPAPDTFEGA